MSQRTRHFKTFANHSLRMTGLCKRRFLDPGKQTGMKKDVHHANIVKELDKHDTLKP